MKAKIFLLLCLNTLALFAVLAETIETQSGKVFENVKIEKDSGVTIEFADKDGIITRIKKDKIKTITTDKDEKHHPSVITPDSDLHHTGPGAKPQSSLPEHSIQLTQSLSNDGAFQGTSLYGERSARRNQTKYREFYEAYYLTTGIEFLGLPKQFKFGITVMNPLVDRTNTDADLFLQSQPGGQNKTDIINSSLNSGTLQYDPNSIKPRREQNKLLDFVFSRMAYEHETRLGTFYTGFLFFSIIEPTNILRGFYFVGWKPRFLSFLNPNLAVNTKMTSEYGGIYQGNYNYRLSFSHEFFKGQKFRIVPSVVIGYMDVNNSVSNKRGFSDVSPRLQFEYLNFFLAFNYMFRTNTDLIDNQFITPEIGVYPNTSQTDGKTINPARVYGYKNEYIINQLSALASNEIVRRELIESYQEQKIVGGIFYVNIGYSIKL